MMQPEISGTVLAEHLSGIGSSESIESVLGLLRRLGVSNVEINGQTVRCNVSLCFNVHFGPPSPTQDGGALSAAFRPTPTDAFAQTVAQSVLGDSLQDDFGGSWADAAASNADAAVRELDSDADSDTPLPVDWEALRAAIAGPMATYYRYVGNSLNMPTLCWCSKEDDMGDCPRTRHNAVCTYKHRQPLKQAIAILNNATLPARKTRDCIMQESGTCPYAAMPYLCRYRHAGSDLTDLPMVSGVVDSLIQVFADYGLSAPIYLD